MKVVIYQIQWVDKPQSVSLGLIVEGKPFEVQARIHQVTFGADDALVLEFDQNYWTLFTTQDGGNVLAKSLRDLVSRFYWNSEVNLPIEVNEKRVNRRVI
jgi:hypothetical protein